MKLATVRTAGGTRAVRVDDDGAVDLGCADVRALLDWPDWRAAAPRCGTPRPSRPRCRNFCIAAK